MKTWKKLLGFEINAKILAALAVLALAALLLPLLRLAFYAIPWYDDYNFMSSARAFSEQFEKSYVYGAFRTMKENWFAWQGTYTTTFLTALNPFLYGDEYQKAGIIAVVLIFTVCTFAFCFTMTDNLFRAKRSDSIFIASVVTAALIGLIYTAQQGIYWYNAAIHYTLLPGVCFLMIAAYVKILYSKNIVSAVFLMAGAAVLGVVVGGSNYVTILQALLVLLTIVFLGFLYRNKRVWFLLFPTAVYIVCFWINVTAPGNSVRGNSFEGDGVIEAIFNSFAAAGRNFGELTGPMMPVLMLLLLPVFWNLVKNTRFEFRFPGLVALYSVCLYATGFTSSRFAMGTDGVSRAWIPVKFTLQLLLFMNELYWLGWFVQKKREKKPAEDCPHFLLYYTVIAALALIVFFLTPNQAGSYSPYGAYYYVHTGEAYNFYQEYLERVEILESEEQNVVLEPYRFKPWFLCRGDLTEHPDSEENEAMAKWYRKTSIVCAPESARE